MEKVTVRDLTPEELLELKGEYNNYTPQGRMHASIDEITDEEVFDHYFLILPTPSNIPIETHNVLLFT